MVVTFNIRSLKNYFDLRDSGAAWFQIQWLAEEMKKVTPVVRPEETAMAAAPAPAPEALTMDDVNAMLQSYQQQI